MLTIVCVPAAVPAVALQSGTLLGGHKGHQRSAGSSRLWSGPVNTMAVCCSPLKVLLVALLAASAFIAPVAAGRRLSQCELHCFLCTLLTLVAEQQAASHVKHCSTMQSFSPMMQKVVWRQMCGRSSIDFSSQSTLSLTCVICLFCRCCNRGPSVAEQVTMLRQLSHCAPPCCVQHSIVP